MFFLFTPFFLSVNFTAPKIEIPDISRVVEEQKERIEEQKQEIKDKTEELKTKYAIFNTFKDANYQNPTNHFQKGETVYVKINATTNADISERAQLLDSQKQLISEKTLDKGDNYYFTNFLLPDKNGTYYLDVKIQSSDGFSFSGQKNINVSSQTDIEKDEDATSSAEGSPSGKAHRIFPSIFPTIFSNKPSIIISPPVIQEKIIEEVTGPLRDLFQKILNIFNLFSQEKSKMQ